MSWTIIAPGSSFTDNSGSVPWDIKDNQVITIPPCREMSLYEELVINGIGELCIEDGAKLIIED